ncbi:hypothetical protein AAC387_Pa10g0665 [Persea americana]
MYRNKNKAWLAVVLRREHSLNLVLNDFTYMECTGLHRPSMQASIRYQIRHLKLAMIIMFESKLKHSSYTFIVNSVVPHGWKESSVKASTTQCMHCEVMYGNEHFFFTACYGFNDYMHRRDLWQTIQGLSPSCGLPWIVAGDFNTVRWNHEKTGGAAPRARGLIDFSDCIHDAGLFDLNLTGPLYTWSNSSIGASRIECKLDRVLINAGFLHSSPFKGEILMRGLSDHSPVLLFFACQTPHQSSVQIL